MTLVKLISFALCLLGAGVTNGQDQVSIIPRPRRAATAKSASMRISHHEVLLPVAVTDPFGASYRGLTKEAFHIFAEDGIEKEPCFLLGEDGPVSIGIIFDESGSMKNKLNDTLAAVNQLFVTADPDDEYFLVEFADRPEFRSDFTRDTEEIKNWLSGVVPHGWTALNDAIYLGMNQMRSAGNPRKALVVFSDGGDNLSRYSRKELLAAAREANLSIFTISIQNSDGFLRQLGEETGGEEVVVKNLGELSSAVWKMSEVMRHHYLVGYCDPPLDGRYHKITVKVTPPPGAPHLTVSWRHGYYSIESIESSRK